jgi:hypothetical protein
MGADHVELTLTSLASEGETMRQERNIRTLVVLALMHQEKPCIKPECDLGAPCKRHQRTAEVVVRYYNLKKKEVRK